MEPFPGAQFFGHCHNTRWAGGQGHMLPLFNCNAMPIHLVNVIGPLRGGEIQYMYYINQ